ncbi:MAG TPA: OmpH family outer membrane protein [Candidatus Binatia bacterium]|nr:OmpH family outer membrane protein [Candidatus Binatia bacterium]
MKKGWMVFFMLLFSASAWAQEKIKMGYIDIQRAIVESQSGKKAKENFQAQVKKAEGELLKEKQELERLKSDLDKKSPLLKEEERRSLEKELDRRYVGYQRTMRDSQEELRQRENEMTAVILRELEKIVAEIGKNEKFTLILERSQVLYIDQGIDITNKVIEVYNSRSPGKVTKAK